MITFIIISCIVVICGFTIAMLYMQKHHEDVAQFRVVEKDKLYYVQRHEFITTHDGFSHSVWNYVCNRDLIHPEPLAFEHYKEAQECVEQLRDEWLKASKESFRDYLKRKRDDFDIIYYFD